MYQKFLDRIFDKFLIAREVGSVVEQCPVEPICQLTKCDAVPELALVPKVKKNFVFFDDALFLVQDSYRVRLQINCNLTHLQGFERTLF